MNQLKAKLEEFLLNVGHEGRIRVLKGMYGVIPKDELSNDESAFAQAFAVLRENEPMYNPFVNVCKKDLAYEPCDYMGAEMNIMFPD